MGLDARNGLDCPLRTHSAILSCPRAHVFFNAPTSADEGETLARDT